MLTKHYKFILPSSYKNLSQVRGPPHVQFQHACTLNIK